MSELVLQGVVDGPLLGVNARFWPGCAALLGSDAAALAGLVALVAGAREPRRGRVLLDGAPLHASPERRRDVGALLCDEHLPALPRVSDALAAILAARAERGDARAFLDTVGLAAWAARRPEDLDASERRTLALALALAHPRPRLLALYEPFAAGRELAADFVRSGLERAVSAGAIVVVATQSQGDARALGAAPWLFERGTLVNLTDFAPSARSDAEQALAVETPDARRLAAALAREPAVRGVRWNETESPDTVFVFGADTELLASAVVRALGAESARVRSITLAPTPVPALLAHSTSPFSVAGAPSPTPYAPPPYGVPGASYPAPGAPYPAPGVASSAPQATAPAPADQSVTMPTSFSDPTRPPSGGST
jgi:ABC-type thiamine transport system ATPase subunit